MTQENKDNTVVMLAISAVGNVFLIIMLVVIVATAPKAKYGSVTSEDWHVAQLTCAGGKLLSLWLSENDKELVAHCQLGKGFYDATFDRQRPAKEY